MAPTTLLAGTTGMLQSAGGRYAPTKFQRCAVATVSSVRERCVIYLQSIQVTGIDIKQASVEMAAGVVPELARFPFWERSSVRDK